ncbi:2-amino-4-hydroxy-6-hydroxymethyldihydropteridine diphosphokinase [Palleronia sp. LCG004]|uniref:2-amino-4-hydroxy-6- hydroxymethyldihydropteridine diphosphokinase n=1 Tax=Palleronia sp. LCG004 TaxID=3079304 RepID=UPI002942816A|nr:2-amino-4-hydroxy-6-hydroxymethyldihydropteridine diphosphokinase [Palleronia sp. LCG004]WOI55762.1 2-amino-4-hydroxy-6-hydroxymethyldihydropteridine diphosphokinase [Palleronia sp. LCG004]
MTPRKCHIALGANLPGPGGAPERTLMMAVEHLRRHDFRLLSLSRLFRSPAFPAGSGPDFVNAVAAFSTPLPPSAIVARLHACERALGRMRLSRWGPRTVDLDLLAVERSIRPDVPSLARWMRLPPSAQRRLTPRRLILPHPRMQDRGFVLLPMAETAPDWRHPVLGLTVRQMLAARPPGELAAIVPIDGGFP